MIRPDWLLLIGLAPMMLGPLSSGGDSITAQLCNGGTVTIPIERDNEQQPERDCRFQACHAGTCRKRDRLTQPS